MWRGSVLTSMYRLQAMISNHREKENKKSLTNKELASLLGVRPDTVL
jgi:Mn-dependent DtxR family transcriptional regulator